MEDISYLFGSRIYHYNTFTAAFSHCYPGKFYVVQISLESNAHAKYYIQGVVYRKVHLNISINYKIPEKSCVDSCNTSFTSEHRVLLDPMDDG